MDYVTWCGIVLDEIVGAVGDNLEYRIEGFTRDDVASFVFDDTKDGFNSLPDVQQRALQQAIGSLYYQHALANSILDAGFDRFWLTSRGREGSAELESGWSFIVHDELDEESAALLEIVNESSENISDEYSWLESVPVSLIIEHANWENGDRLIPFLLSGMSSLGSDGWLFLGRTDQDLQIVHSTYRGLVRTTRRDTPNTLAQLFDDLVSNPWSSITRLEFGFILDEPLRAIVRADYEEAAACQGIGAWKASAILFASALEGMLMGALWNHENIRPQHQIEWARQQNRRFRAPDNSIDWNEMTLGALIALAEYVNLIDSGSALLAKSVTDFRNRVHPRNELQAGTRATETQVGVLERVIADIHSQLDLAQSGS